MTNPVYVVDIIGQIVAATQLQILSTIQANETAVMGKPSLIQTIDYQYGHKRELIQTLAQMDRSPSSNKMKYPLVYLVQDFIETRGREAGVYAYLNLSIIIAHQTDPNFKITDRMAKVFKPVLYPIYYSLIEQISIAKQVFQDDENMIEHKKIDRSYWGTSGIGGNDKNALNDYVDAIEIENLSIKLFLNSCLTA